MARKTDKPHPPSLHELLCRQVLALVKETADTACPKDQDILAFEAELLRVLIVNCTARRTHFEAAIADQKAG